MDLRHIPVGSKIRVEGILFTAVNKKKLPEPGLKVCYMLYVHIVHLEFAACLRSQVVASECQRFF